MLTRGYCIIFALGAQLKFQLSHVGDVGGGGARVHVLCLYAGNSSHMCSHTLHSLNVSCKSGV